MNCADNGAIGKYDGKGRFRSASSAVFPLGCSRDGGHTMEAAFGKAPLISRKGKNTDALGRFA
ncbi:hypothetical protein WCP94_004234 [Bilophila wadsworthia]